MDRTWQASPSSADRHLRRQGGVRSRQGTAVITHPEKVLFPDDGITKGELAAYYEAIAPIMLPHIRARPVTMERYHRGIAEKGLFQKNVSKGFHIVVPLDGKGHIGEVFSFGDAVGRLLVERDPEHLTQEFAKVDRAGRIYIDTGRNGFGATFAAAYAVRAKPGAPVSAPCTWEELARGDACQIGRASCRERV